MTAGRIRTQPSYHEVLLSTTPMPTRPLLFVVLALAGCALAGCGSTRPPVRRPDGTTIPRPRATWVHFLGGRVGEGYPISFETPVEAIGLRADGDTLRWTDVDGRPARAHVDSLYAVSEASAADGATLGVVVGGFVGTAAGLGVGAVAGLASLVLPSDGSRLGRAARIAGFSTAGGLVVGASAGVALGVREAPRNRSEPRTWARRHTQSAEGPPVPDGLPALGYRLPEGLVAPQARPR